jgi:hypothetical protein
VIVLFTIAPAYQDLGTNAETETDHKKNNIIDARQTGSAKLNLSYSAEKNGVGYLYYILC